ncbi:S1C family serine protease [Pedobacter insulae]|uniref:Serine protease Do n=1 Tax=Pedobacter insulae TaxID=414048 RepID=A0A1I2Z8H2_9SPHI|nr:trypsin-like peptidase domain-containing protein [Pedobacter insulae]SFH34084.1 serine protease Do [Pedobacter insulae]
MNNLNLRQITVWFLSLALSSSVFAQPASKELQQKTIEAIKKVYPASVRLWGFDVTKNERNSAQFSGVVVTKDGVILTAAHTVSPGQTYKVFFPDGRTAMAKALGRIDLAESRGIPDVGMLQLMENGPFPFAELGNSSNLIQTAPCISISYPEKLNQELPTIRFGQIVDPKNQYGFIQSSCKMEPGDSGGPLFDIDGKVIGIHSAIDVSETMNFEVPIDVFRKYWTALHEEKNYAVYPAADSLTVNAGAIASPSLSRSFLKHSKLANNVVLVQSMVDDKKTTAEATLLNFKDARGKKSQWMIGKSSLLTGSLTMVNSKGSKIEVVYRDPENDLVLLKSVEKQQGGFKIEAGQSVIPNIGTFVTSLFHDGKQEHSIVGGTNITLPKSSSIPYLGIAVLYKSTPATVSVIKPGTPAARAGIKAGDSILSINGIILHQASDFTPTLAKFWAGEQVQVVWRSAGKQHEQQIPLIDRAFVPSNHPVDKFAGGNSTRRDGFPAVFVHDAIILPTQCGAPIVDIHGNLLGITIARYSRAVALGLPTPVIISFLEKATSIR